MDMKRPNGCSFGTFSKEIIVKGITRERISSDAVNNGDTLGILLELSAKQKKICVTFFHNDEKMGIVTELDYEPPFYFALCMYGPVKFTVLAPDL